MALFGNVTGMKSIHSLVHMHYDVISHVFGTAFSLHVISCEPILHRITLIPA